DAVLDDLLEAVECAATDEENVRGVDLYEVLVRMLAPTLRRNVRHRALQNLEQRLLDTLAADVARDRRVVRLARDLVDLVYVDDAALGARDVEIRRLDQTEQDVLDVFAHVPRFGESRRVRDAEGHVDDARERLRGQRLAATGGPDQQHVRLLQLDVAVRLRVRDALVMVEDGDREHLLRVLLADNVLVERRRDHLRIRDGPRLAALLRGGAVVLLQHLLAEVDALIADVDTRSRNELAYLLLALAAEGAARVPPPIVAIGIAVHHLDGLAGVLRQDLVEAPAHAQDLLRMDLDVRCLSLKATGRLVNEDARVRQAVAHAGRAAGEKHRRH